MAGQLRGSGRLTNFADRAHLVLRRVSPRLRLIRARSRAALVALESAEPEVRSDAGRRRSGWDRAPWLDDLRDVPPEAYWPRVMTGPHPLAVGSLRRRGRDLRRGRGPGSRSAGGSGSSCARVLEHDAAGALVWSGVATLDRAPGRQVLAAPRALPLAHPSGRAVRRAAAGPPHRQGPPGLPRDPATGAGLGARPAGLHRPRLERDGRDRDARRLALADPRPRLGLRLLVEPRPRSTRRGRSTPKSSRTASSRRWSSARRASSASSRPRTGRRPR